jgi:hypothetical protein
MIISESTARRGIKAGRYLVRQLDEDGTEHPDIHRMPRTETERRRAITITGDGLRGRDGVRYLALDDVWFRAVDHVAISWED